MINKKLKQEIEKYEEYIDQQNSINWGLLIHQIAPDLLSKLIEYIDENDTKNIDKTYKEIMKKVVETIKKVHNK